MFNLGGPEWDDWNRSIRRTLIETQCRDGCEAGSWDPERPTLDIQCMKAGRIATTALSTLTLEVYYRYLPLYRIRNPEDRPARPSRLRSRRRPWPGSRIRPRMRIPRRSPRRSPPPRRRPIAALGCKAVWYTSRFKPEAGRMRITKTRKHEIGNSLFLSCFRAFVIPLLFVEDMT